jgi:choline kinase
VAKLRAVVLAAGRGVRMGAKMPKPVLPLDDAEPTLHYLLQGLESRGVSDLLVVTGFMPAAIQEFVDDRWQSDITYVRNARFASWGNFHSVRLAIDQSPGFDLLVLNADIVINPDVFARVTSSQADLVLAVEQRLRLEQEQMRVKLDGDRVLAIGKHLSMPQSHAEFCGVSLIRPTAAAAYAQICDELEWRAETQVYYEDVFARMFGRVDVRAVPVSAGEYAEVDIPEDVATARPVVDRCFGETRASAR